MKQILTQLFEQKTLDRAAAKRALLDLSTGDSNDSEIASFLTVFLMRPIAVEEVLGFRDALLELSIPFDLRGVPAIDVVGTGGDGKNTFNISTLSAFVLAGAGYPVCKHGNYGVSSACGSSNVLEHLGYQFTNDADELHRQLDAAGICFLHAPLFHPAMKRVAPVRRQLRVKTFFNLMGPLVNPAQPPFQLFGVYAFEIGRLYQYVLQAAEKQFAVVYALDGYDEISLTGPVQRWTDSGEQLLQPTDFASSPLSPEALHGGDTVEAAAALFRAILAGDSTAEQEAVVIANAGAAIQVIHPDRSLADCRAEAAESLHSGRAAEVLTSLLNTQN